MIKYWMDIILSSAIGAMVMIAVLGFGMATTMPGMERWSKRFFQCFFAILGLLAASVYLEAIAYTHSEPTRSILIKLTVLVETLFPATLIVMMAVYLLHCCNEDLRTSRLLRALAALWAVFALVVITAQFTDHFYTVTPDNEYRFGSAYALGLSPLIAILVLNLVGVIRRRDQLSRKLYRAFLAFLLPLTVALLIHLVAPNFLLVDIGLAISALSMFIIVVSDQIERHLRLQEETTRQRSQLMVLRMRPHFIHNTMTSIYYLCDQDPKKAQQVTMDFNTYLRKNFNAIAKDEAIPFSGELEHTRAYLAVEQAQFENKLIIDFDVTYTLFRIPPLTLQPLAENSVKHGMSPSTIPLHVIIRTRREESACKVIVEDSGPGCDPAVAGDPSTTLANIRERLALMCKGTLDIAPREGGGTIVTVTVPNP